MDRQPLKLNTQWLPNPNQQFTSPPPNMPPPTLQNSQGARIIPHLPTGGTFPILAHTHTHTHTRHTILYLSNLWQTLDSLTAHKYSMNTYI